MRGNGLIPSSEEPPNFNLNRRGKDEKENSKGAARGEG